MSFRVLLTPEAEEQLRATDEWWQENRTTSPDLFIDEFERVVELLREMPGLGPRFRRATIPGVRRILLRRSGYWVYYVPDESRSLVYVLAVWSGRRGRVVKVFQRAPRQPFTTAPLPPLISESGVEILVPVTLSTKAE